MQSSFSPHVKTVPATPCVVCLKGPCLVHPSQFSRCARPRSIPTTRRRATTDFMTIDLTKEPPPSGELEGSLSIEEKGKPFKLETYKNSCPN